MNDPKPKLARRAILGGAATAGTLAAAATLLPSRPDEVAAVEPRGASVPAEGEARRGYQVTEHVTRYYATARI